MVWEDRGGGVERIKEPKKVKDRIRLGVGRRVISISKFELP